jgi:hypothetical protein
MTVPKCFEVDPVQFRIGVAARDRVNHPSGACLSVRYTCIIPPDAQWDRCRNQGTFQLRKPASPRTANFDYDSQWNPCAPAGSTHGLFVTYSWIDFVYGLKATGRIAGQIAAAFVQCSRQSSETFFSPNVPLQQHCFHTMFHSPGAVRRGHSGLHRTRGAPCSILFRFISGTNLIGCCGDQSPYLPMLCGCSYGLSGTSIFR